MASSANDLASLEAAIPKCEACPRLRTYCEGVASTKIKRFADQTYVGKPAPGFGDPQASILIVGLAPAAHGANRTGRLFTGDRSGDVLYAALHRAGLGSKPHSVARDDGLALSLVYISAACRCAPPENRPTPEELATCRPFLRREIELLSQLRVVLALGAIAHQAAWQALHFPHDPAVPKFRHGAEHSLLLTRPARDANPANPAHPATPQRTAAITLLDCYHVSQRNTFTGLMTNAMLDDILRRARQLSDGGISTR
jgi:uracil-DNA glycosylase family 4